MKREFRKKCLNLRNTLKKTELAQKILNLEEYKAAQTVFIYVSYGSEAGTEELIKEALKEKTVLVPYCVDEKIMIASKINSLSELKTGHYGILEPENPKEYTGKIDLTVVPGVAFSIEGFRLGYGKGYYDRFLASHKTFSLGICHDELIFDKIPCDKFDYRLDMILSQKREIRI